MVCVNQFPKETVRTKKSISSVCKYVPIGLS